MGELCTLVSCLVVVCLMVGGGREGEDGGLWGRVGVGHGNCTKKIPQGFTFVVIRSGNLWYPCVLPLNIVFLCLKCTSFNVCACLLIFMCCCFLFRACVCVFCLFGCCCLGLLGRGEVDVALQKCISSVGGPSMLISLLLYF